MFHSRVVNEIFLFSLLQHFKVNINTHFFSFNGMRLYERNGAKLGKQWVCTDRERNEWMNVNKINSFFFLIRV